MSRTFKDRPRRIRLADNLKKGLIDHDHRALPASERWRPARELDATYFKRDTVAIQEYKDYLGSLGSSYRYTLIEVPGLPPTRRWHQDKETDAIYSTPVEGYPKTVRFEVEYLFEYPGRVPHCTHPKDYDPVLDIDRATGNRADCTPLETHEYWGWYSDSEKNRNSRGKVKASLKKVTGLANTGLLDADYSDPTYELEYGRKVWVWTD